jgi:hypothetical protein
MLLDTYLLYSKFMKFHVSGMKNLAVIMLEIIFFCGALWNITSCSPLSVNRRFGETCRLDLEGRRVSQARNQQAASRACHSLSPACFLLVSLATACHLLASCWFLLLGLLFDPLNRGDMFIQNVG